MRVLLFAFVMVALATMGHAQASKVCRADVPDSSCPAISNDISNTLFRTSAVSATVTVTGTIMTRPPAVANSMVYKDAVGTIMTASNTYIASPGSANESLIAINANINVLNTNLLQLTSTTLPTCNAGNYGRVGMSGTKLCVCDGTSYKNVLGCVNIVT